MSEAQVAPALSLTALIQEVEGLVKTIEGSARALMEQGNTSLAQQQLLLAATLDRTVKSVESAYKSSLDDTYTKLGTEEKNVFDNLKDLANSLQNVEKNTNVDLSDRIYQTQSAANQLLDRLPLTSHYPILVGAKIKGFLDQRDQNDADIAILGYLLADPQLNYKKPEVKIDGEVIPPNFVGAFYDRINVQIPDNLKDKIRFVNSPCAPRKTFRIEVVAHYQKPLFGLIKWGTETDVSLSLNSLPGRVTYAVKVVGSGTRTFAVHEPRGFSNLSPYISVGCEGAASTSVAWNVPSDAKDLNGSGRWIETSNLKQESASAVPNGSTIVAQGTIVGLDKQGVLVKNCPGGGHGRLEVFGTYFVDVDHQESYSYPTESTIVSEPARCMLPSEVSLPMSANSIVQSGSWLKQSSTTAGVGGLFGSLFQSIAQAQSTAMRAVSEINKAAQAQALKDGSKSKLSYSEVNIAITRKDCPAIIDTISISVPSDPNQGAVVTSKNGLFKGSLRQNSLVVEKIGEP